MRSAQLKALLVEAAHDSLRHGSMKVPAGGHLVWTWFNALCRTRTSHGYGPNPISFAEIEAYARLYRWPLEQRHVEMILAMDRVWMSHALESISRNQQNGRSQSLPAGPAVAMTPAAFDAVFG